MNQSCLKETHTIIALVTGVWLVNEFEAPPSVVWKRELDSALVLISSYFNFSARRPHFVVTA